MMHAPSAYDLIPIGSRVRHHKHGVGTLASIMADGRRVVEFDSGDSHRYAVSSMHKLLFAGQALLQDETGGTLSSAQDKLLAKTLLLTVVWDRAELCRKILTGLGGKREVGMLPAVSITLQKALELQREDIVKQLLELPGISMSKINVGKLFLQARAHPLGPTRPFTLATPAPPLHGPCPKHTALPSRPRLARPAARRRALAQPERRAPLAHARLLVRPRQPAHVFAPALPDVPKVRLALLLHPLAHPAPHPQGLRLRAAARCAAAPHHAWSPPALALALAPRPVSARRHPRGTCWRVRTSHPGRYLHLADVPRQRGARVRLLADVRDAHPYGAAR